MRPFGCPVTILNTIDHLDKFDGKADEGFFVGYSLNSKVFKVFNSRTRIVEENLHIRFSKSKPNVVGSGPDWLFDIDALTRITNYESIIVGTQSNGFVDPKSCHDDGSKPTSDDGKKVDEDIRKESECKDQEKEDNVNTTNNVNTVSLTVNAAGTNEVNVEEPKKVIHALKDPSWIEAIQEELLQFKYTQEEGIDYDEVFAPVARIKAIRIFLAYASFKDFEVYQMDVKSVFLYEKIKEEVYVCQVPGFEDPNFPDRVYKVEKALYRLHQAPRAWYETWSTYLLDNGFQRGKIDKTLFIKRHKGDILLMSSIGELTFLLGLQVNQKKDGIFISQDKYVVEILKKFWFTEVKTASIPMETQKPLLKDEDGEEVDVHMYRSMIGSLMYLTSSRLDIMFAVCAYARRQLNPKVSHLHAVKSIFRNLKGQPKLGLWYPKDYPFDLVAYTDSDYARESLDRKSTTGVPRNHGGTTAQTRFESVSKHSNDSLLTRGNTLQSDGDSIKLNELMALCTTSQNRVLDLEKTTTTQRNEIASYKKRVKKLEKKNRARTHRLKRLYKVCGIKSLLNAVGITAAHVRVSATNAVTLPKTQVVEGVTTVMPITTVEEKAQRRLKVKARSTLTMGISNEHQLMFNYIKDAKQLLEAIEKRFADLDTMSMDDLYNNLKVYELKFKGISSLSSTTQNMAFMSSLNNNSSSTNRIVNTAQAVNTAQVVNTARGVSTASTKVNAAFFTNIDNLSDAFICSFFASQPSCPQLIHEDLKQIHLDVIEEIDSRWQMDILTMRARKFLKRLGRKLTISDKKTIGFYKYNVECYNCHKRVHFARECRASKNHDNKHKEILKRSVHVKTSASTALVSCNGLGGYDWSDQADEGPNYALMAFSSSSSDSEKGLGCENYNAVLPTYTGDFMPSTPDLSFTGLDEFANKPVAENVKAKSSEEEAKAVRKNNDAPIIKEWVSDDEEDNDYAKINGGYVAFGGNHKGGKITRNRTLTLSFMRPFGCLVTILNTIDHLGKFDGKADEGFFVGYSLNSKAFRVFNSKTRIVEENLHIRLSESTPNNIGTRSNGFVGTKASDNAEGSLDCNGFNFFMLCDLDYEPCLTFELDL
uniref:Putative ribonuclease H-like domain-containing protein n=1 Tax=Tanacetum cinerariifolium TaxID=118510 RepID=A0A6L2JX63_TANCI|nr:putative ribonuclease H-like domain-containing protein [Tanacetum cinerariifolium]